MSIERPEAAKFGPTIATLVGPELKAGMPAPDFTVLDAGLAPVSLQDTHGKTRVVLSVPSVDTGVCSTEIREFAKRAAADLPDVPVFFVSMDLPFRLKSWCATEGVDGVTLTTDHREATFGAAWGVLMKELRLLSRAAFVVSPGGEITHAEYLYDAGDLPDFDAIIEAAKAATASA